MRSGRAPEHKSRTATPDSPAFAWRPQQTTDFFSACASLMGGRLHTLSGYGPCHVAGGVSRLASSAAGRLAHAWIRRRRESHGTSVADRSEVSPRNGQKKKTRSGWRMGPMNTSPSFYNRPISPNLTPSEVRWHLCSRFRPPSLPNLSGRNRPFLGQKPLKERASSAYLA